MSQATPTDTTEWEDRLVATPEATMQHCYDLYEADHLRALFDVLEPGSKIVEAGCGLGQFVYMFASLGHHCIGLDYSAKLIEQAKRRGEFLPDLSGSVEWVEGTILDMPFEDNSLDCYASFGVLEHFRRPQQRQILAEAARVLRVGGILYQYVPSFWSPWTIRREIRYWYRKLRPPHMVWQRNMRRSLVRSLCRQAGFDEVECHSVYADVALRSMKLPSVMRKACPRGIRRASNSAAKSLGRWCDRHDVLGYGLVYVGKKTQ